MSTYDLMGIPERLSIAAVAVTFFFLIAPYASGWNFIRIQIPEFTPKTKRALQIIGPLLFAISILMFFPYWQGKSPEEDSSPVEPVAEEPWVISDLGMTLVYVAPGGFQMGSKDGPDDEKPVRTVKISQAYWMGKHEVTQEQYESITGDNPSGLKNVSNPVEQASWNDAVSFCVNLTNRERQAGRLTERFEYRLPTEAEWEYAARGGRSGQVTKYAGSDSIGDVAWYTKNSGEKTHPVGQKQANDLGICDMSGNVWEWCLDHWHETYQGKAPTDGSAWQDSDSDSFRVVRGGSWDYSAEDCRCASRAQDDPHVGGGSVGFRVVLARTLKLTDG